ncbi:MAG: helix-turn-helix domain-containing protein [Fimbriimonas ginsengisoli]|uniref:Helix-turn-helix domain-containing protein n=1 Tax=Fimbriimonas ginsengisoli TaxID=1005039 RepID=A0A931LVS8_FIMGI|nr:helix-turn-helix domain-containing protein [Fimbriimonas ginsengisoli]
MRSHTEDFDPLAYIEKAFLDTRPVAPEVPTEIPQDNLAINTIREYLTQEELRKAPEGLDGRPAKRQRFRKTEMSAPRPRRKPGQKAENTIDPELREVWEAVPRNIVFLCGFFDDSVTANYYGGEFKESRHDLIRRLLDPELSLEEASRLLGVCPATVRRYTNRNWLAHHRTIGGQRRFRLSHIVRFVEEHGRFPEE